jgi:hypothetical protein
MITLARRMALLALTSLLLAGCGDAADKPKADAKMEKKPRDAAKDVAKAPDAKPAADAKKADEKVVAKDDAKAKEAAEEEAAIKANLAKLSPEDRKLAEAQRFCAIQNEERLGGMGAPPMKVMVKGKPVFLCCGSCKKEALAEPDKTLAKVEDLKKKVAAEMK